MLLSLTHIISIDILYSKQIKYYLEGNGYDREIVVSTLREVVDELGDKWLEAKSHNLGHP